MHGPSNPPARLRYLPALDGLRGLAVLAVVGYHAELSFLPGGFLGVELFFVVSGFLITSLLVAERRSTGRIDLRRFWIRRARRLLPALFLVLVSVAVVVRVFLPDEIPRTRGGLLASVGYVMNWHLVWTGQSYFESVGRPPLLQHLWSLGIEEQYYLLWPLLVSALLALGGRRALALACAVGALASTVLMAVLVDPAAPSRVYYGTDTRAAGLLVGGLLALTMIGVRAPRPAAGARRGMDVAGLAALAALAALFARTSEFDPALYSGGFLRFAAVTAVLLFVVAVPGTVAARVLGCRALVGIGLRSYGLYLWHWPVFQLTRPHLDVALDGLELLALRLAITAALTEVSFQLVEQPLRTGAAGRWLDSERLRRSGGTSPRWGARLAVAGAGSVVAVVVAAYALAPARPSGQELAGGSGFAPPVLASTVARPVEPTTTTTTATAAPPPTVAATAALTTLAGDTVPPASEAAPTTTPPAGGEPAPAPVAEQPPPVVEPQPTPPPPADLAPAEVPPPPPAPPLPRPAHAVGDSVLLAASGAVTASFAGHVTIDAVVGRQPADGVSILEAWAPAHPGVDLIVALGSNGILRPEDVSRILAAAGPDRRVVFVNVAVPRRWEGPSNEALRQVLPGHPNAVLVDWHAVVQGDRSLLRSDGVHPNARGAEVLAGWLRSALP